MSVRCMKKIIFEIGYIDCFNTFAWRQTEVKMHSVEGFSVRTRRSRLGHWVEFTDTMYNTERTVSDQVIHEMSNDVSWCEW